MTASSDISAAPPLAWNSPEAEPGHAVGPVQQSADLDKLAPALVHFQAAVTGAAKGGENPHFRSSYTRLEDAWKAAREALNQNGLSVTQWLCGVEGSVSVTTRVLHASGQWMQSTVTMGLDTSGSKNEAQQYGSTISYAQRYSFLAALGLPPEDDDGEGSHARKPKTTKGVSIAALKKWSKTLTDAGLLDELRDAWLKVVKNKEKFTEDQYNGLADLKDECKEQLQAEDKLV